MYQRLLSARQARRDESGFTLIELLIVVVVLGILAGIVVFGVGTFRDDAETAACEADAKTVSVAAEAFNAKEGRYPTGIAELVIEKYIKTAPTSSVTYDNTDGSTGGC